MTKQLFGTDGIRGVPGEVPLDDATLDRVGLALGEYVSSNGRSPDARARVLIGRDTRESGPHIADRIARGLAAAGVEAVSAGVLTTPGVAWLVQHEGFAAGVVISASHNPYHDNGVKLISSTGMKFPDAVEAELERFILASSESPESRGEMQLHDNEKIDDDYLDGLRAAVLPGARFAGMKIVMDCANGAASKLAPKLFRSLGADVIAINDSPNGRNINADCGSLHPEAMQKRTGQSGASLGVAFDGDADRAIFASGSGRLVDGDGVLLVAGRYLKVGGEAEGRCDRRDDDGEFGIGARAGKIRIEIEAHGRGRSLRAGRDAAHGANLGGEQSGHILFLDDATTGDGMLTAVKLASIIALQRAAG